MAMCKLTPAANSDLQEIWEYTENRWGAEQADIYLRKLDHRMTYLARNPKRGERRTELSGSPFNKHAKNISLSIGPSTRQLRFLPKPLKIERELAVVFDGKKYNLLITKKIEDQVLINDTFPKIVINV